MSRKGRRRRERKDQFFTEVIDRPPALRSEKEAGRLITILDQLSAAEPERRDG